MMEREWAQCAYCTPKLSHAGGLLIPAKTEPHRTEATGKYTSHVTKISAHSYTKFPLKLKENLPQLLTAVLSEVDK